MGEELCRLYLCSTFGEQKYLCLLEIIYNPIPVI